MAFENDDTFEDPFRKVGEDVTAGFEPAGSASMPTEYASSENLDAAGAADAATDDLEDDDDEEDEDDDEDEDEDLLDEDADEEDDEDADDDEELEEDGLDDEDDDEDDDEEEDDETIRADVNGGGTDAMNTRLNDAVKTARGK